MCLCKCLGKRLFVGGRDLHRVNRHVHVVLCDEDDTALGGEMCLESVAVVQVAVVRDGILQSIKGGNALIGLRLGVLGHAEFVHEVPPIRPQFTAQDVLVEEIRPLGAFDRKIDVLQCRFLCFLFLRLKCRESLHGVDFLLYVLREFLVHLGIHDTLKEFDRLRALLRHLCEKMGEPRPCVPVLHTAGKEFVGRGVFSETVDNEMDAFMKCFRRHNFITCFI